MNSVALTKSEIRTLSLRIKALAAELDDPTCQRFPTARMHVQNELNRVKAQLAQA